jgi:hypothetical protein
MELMIMYSKIKLLIDFRKGVCHNVGLGGSCGAPPTNLFLSINRKAPVGANAQGHPSPSGEGTRMRSPHIKRNIRSCPMSFPIVGIYKQTI